MSTPFEVEPMAAPEPPATVPAQVQNATVTDHRFPKDGSIEEHVGGVAVGALFPARRDEVLVSPKSLKHIRIEANVFQHS